MSLFPHAVIPLPAQGLNSYTGLAHDWKDLVKVGPNMTKAKLTGKIYQKNTKPNQKKNPKKPVLWKGAPALRSLHRWRHVPRGSQLSRVLRGGRTSHRSDPLSAQPPHCTSSGFAHQRHGLTSADSNLATTAHISSPTQHKCANRAWLPVLSSASMCFTPAPVTELYEEPVPTESSALPALYISPQLSQKWSLAY